MPRPTRRQFLQGSLGAGLALTLRSGARAAPFSRPLGANDDLRLAVVGLGQTGAPGVGGRGRQLIDLFRKVPHVRIVALCDVDQRILNREMERFAGWHEKVQPYTDLRHLVGPHAERANGFSRRNYRKPFVLPEIA